jgi:perosamine synthetase
MTEFIPWGQPAYWGNELRYVTEAVSSTWISGGPFVDRLEAEVARLCGASHAVSTSNGTTALQLMYLAIGLAVDDEVVIPGFAFLAAANVALHMRARPVFADVDSETWCMRASDAERCLSPRTRAIVAVHPYGNLCPMDELLELGKLEGIPVLEDAAEAFGSRSRGRAAGAIAPLGSFSFHATKTVTTGEGGMVLAQGKSAYDAMCLYRNHGMSRRRYWHDVAGHNFRLTNIQAALGCGQIEHVETIFFERKRVHARYLRHLASATGVVAQVVAADVDPVIWVVAIRVDPHVYPQGRDTLMAQLHEKGIETRPGFYAPSSMPHLYAAPPLPVAGKLSEEVITLPSYPTLTDEQIDRICQALVSLRR